MTKLMVYLLTIKATILNSVIDLFTDECNIFVKWVMNKNPSIESHMCKFKDQNHAKRI